jgi:uncharacterized membrane protein YdjX (TVP38/TMEM64 family)
VSAPEGTDSGPNLRFADLGRTGVLALVWAIAPALATLAIVAFLGEIAAWFDGLGSAAPFVYVALFASAAGLGLAPTYSPSFLAGWIFGFATGFPVALFALLGAATLGYAVARGVSSREVEKLLARFPKAEAVRRELVGRGPLASAGVVALLRVPPNSPFSLSNLALGAARVAFAPFAAGSIVGIAPRTAVYVGLGAAAASNGATDLGEALSVGKQWPLVVAGVVLLLVVLHVLGRMAQRALDRIAREGAATPLP